MIASYNGSIYIFILSAADGSIADSGYKSSSNGFTGILGSAINGDYIAFSATIPTTYYLALWNFVTKDIYFKTYTGSLLYGLGVDFNSGRYVQY